MPDNICTKTIVPKSTKTFLRERKIYNGKY